MSGLKHAAQRAMDKGGLIIREGGFIEWQWAEPGVIVPGAAWVHPDYRRRGLYIRLCGLVAEVGGAVTYRAYSHIDRKDITAAAELMGWKEKERQGDIIIWENPAQEVAGNCQKLLRERYGL